MADTTDEPRGTDPARLVLIGVGVVVGTLGLAVCTGLVLVLTGFGAIVGLGTQVSNEFDAIDRALQEAEKEKEAAEETP